MKRTRLMAVGGRRLGEQLEEEWKEEVVEEKKYTIKSINRVDVISTDPRKKQLAQQAVYSILCTRDDVIGGFRARYSDGFYREYVRRVYGRL